MSDYVNFALFLLTFLFVGFFWNKIFTPLRENYTFRSYLVGKSLFHFFLLFFVLIGVVYVK